MGRKRWNRKFWGGLSLWGYQCYFPCATRWPKCPARPATSDIKQQKDWGAQAWLVFSKYWKCLVIFALLLEWFPPFWVRQDCSSRAQVTLAWRSVNFWRALFQQINPLKPPSTVYSVQYGYIISGLGWVQRPVQSKYHLILLQNKKCWRHVKLNHFFSPTAHCSKEIFVPW